MKLLALLPFLAGSYLGPASQISRPQDVSILHNEITPNGDGRDDYLRIENITVYPDNRVTILNRHGDKVFDLWGYDNQGKVFAGKSNIGEAKELPSGKYSYTIALNDGSNAIEGFLMIKR